MNVVLLIGILLILGLASTRVVKLVKLPNVTGYLVVGLIAAVLCILLDHFNGTTLTNELDKVNNFVSSIALGFIALSIGEEFKLSKIKKLGKRVLVVTFFQALMAVLLVDISLIIVCLLLKVDLSIAIVLGAIAAATAPAATLMVINQYKAKGPLVDTLLPVVAFDDAVALIAFAILFSISKALASNTALNIMDILVWPLVEIVGSIILGAVLGFGISFAFKFFKSRANRMILVIASILIVVGLNVLATTFGWKMFDEDFSFSSLLACMMIGAIFINFRKDAQRTIERIDQFTPPLYMLFFVISGASLNITIFASEGGYLIAIIAAVYIVMRCVGKWTGAFVSSKVTKAEPSVQKYLGFTLFPQAGVAIGLATTAGKLFSLKEETAVAGVLIVAIILTSTLVYEIVGPMVSKFALNKAGEIPAEQ